MVVLGLCGYIECLFCFFFFFLQHLSCVGHHVVLGRRVKQLLRNNVTNDAHQEDLMAYTKIT